jgi:hypothetical protein
MLFQQGDVLLRELKSFNCAGAQRARPRDGRYVIAAGEMTGHAHTVDLSVEVLTVGETRLIRAEHPFTITHEEHGPVTVPAGLWEIGTVREYDHFAQEASEAVRGVED